MGRSDDLRGVPALTSKQGGETPSGPSREDWLVLRPHRNAGDKLQRKSQPGRTRSEPTMSATDLRIRVVPAIADVAAGEWDAGANPNGRHLPAAGTRPASAERRLIEAESDCQEGEYNPFLSHSFLHALEASGSATARTGWQAQHLVAETADGGVLGAPPCYLKSHSRGEYV